VLFSSRVRVKIRVRVRIRFSVWLASGYAHVFALFSVVTVALPNGGCGRKKIAQIGREIDRLGNGGWARGPADVTVVG